MLAAAAASGGSLVPLYYLTGIVAAVAGTAVALRAWYASQRKRWTAEGERQQKNLEAVEANTKAAKDNTRAIGELANRLGKFADETRSALNGHDTRIRHLETRAWPHPHARTGEDKP